MNHREKTLVALLILALTGCAVEVETSTKSQLLDELPPPCVTVLPTDSLELLGCAELEQGDQCGQVHREYNLCDGAEGSVPLVRYTCTSEGECTGPAVMVGESHNVYSDSGTRFDACGCVERVGL